MSPSPQLHDSQLLDLGSVEEGEPLLLSFGGARLGLSDGVSTLPRPDWGLEGVFAGVALVGTSSCVPLETPVPFSWRSPLMSSPSMLTALIFGDEEDRRCGDGVAPGEVGELGSEGLEEGGEGRGDGLYLRNDLI
jgi:hypothetical protein